MADATADTKFGLVGACKHLDKATTMTKPTQILELLTIYRDITATAQILTIGGYRVARTKFSVLGPSLQASNFIFLNAHVSPCEAPWKHEWQPSS